MSLDKSHEVPFSKAKKDKNGYATIVVRFGDLYAPVKGKPEPFDEPDIPLDEDDVPDYDEVRRLDLTAWSIKDIDGLDVLGWEQHVLLYWNGYETAWKFYNGETPPVTDEDVDDDVLDLCSDKIVELSRASELYEPHDDGAGNHGDVDVHCIYDDKESGVPMVVKTATCNAEAVWMHYGTLDEFMCDVDAMISAARRAHKKIPYDMIKDKFIAIASGMDSKKLVKFIMQCQR